MTNESKPEAKAAESKPETKAEIKPEANYNQATKEMVDHRRSGTDSWRLGYSRLANIRQG
jgi:hypothetical protein